LGIDLKAAASVIIYLKMNAPPKRPAKYVPGGVSDERHYAACGSINIAHGHGRNYPLPNEAHMEYKRGLATYDARTLAPGDVLNALNAWRQQAVFRTHQLKFVAFMKVMENNRHAPVVGSFLGTPKDFPPEQNPDPNAPRVSPHEWKKYHAAYNKLVKNDHTWD